MKNIYLLKDLAKITGHSTHTVKYYLRLGLLAEFGRSPTTNFRFFDDAALERLKAIRRLRQKKMSIKTIQDTLNL